MSNETKGWDMHKTQKRRWLAVVVVSLTLLATELLAPPQTAPAQADTTYRIPNYTEYNQPNNSNWCWAASVQMASKMVRGIATDQCTIVTNTLGSTYTCPQRYGERANIDRLKAALRVTGMANNTTATKLPAAATLANTLQSKQPAIVLVNKYGGSEHYIVIYGYKLVGSTYTLYYFDPYSATNGERSIPYTTLNRGGVNYNYTDWYAITTVYGIRK
jgi:hypothetical protein